MTPSHSGADLGGELTIRCSGTHHRAQAARAPDRRRLEQSQRSRSAECLRRAYYPRGYRFAATTRKNVDRARAMAAAP